MSQGKIKEFFPERGYGSIIDSQSSQLLFVYANYVQLKEGETLMVGQEVTYDVQNQRNENWAINVKVIPKKEG